MYTNKSFWTKFYRLLQILYFPQTDMNKNVHLQIKFAGNTDCQVICLWASNNMIGINI